MHPKVCITGYFYIHQSSSGVILRSGTLNSETAEMGVPRYLGWLVLASVETRWNVMGAWPPSHMQSLIFARICLHGELGMWPLNLLTKVMYLTSESLRGESRARD